MGEKQKPLTDDPPRYSAEGQNSDVPKKQRASRLPSWLTPWRKQQPVRKQTTSAKLKSGKKDTVKLEAETPESEVELDDRPIMMCKRCRRFFMWPIRPSDEKHLRQCGGYHPGEYRRLNALIKERGQGPNANSSDFGNKIEVWSCCLSSVKPEWGASPQDYAHQWKWFRPCRYSSSEHMPYEVPAPACS